VRKIELTVDDETAREFDELTENAGGDSAEVIRGLLAIRRSQAGETANREMDAMESGREDELKRGLASAERSFQDGTAVDWNDLRKKLDL